MPEIDGSKDNMISAQEAGIFTVKADQEGAELVNPNEPALRHKAAFVNSGIRKAFAERHG